MFPRFKSVPAKKVYKGTLKRDNGQIIPNSPRAVGIVPTVGGQIETGYHKDLYQTIENHKREVARHSRGKSAENAFGRTAQRRYLQGSQASQQKEMQLSSLRTQLEKERGAREKLQREVQALK